MPLFIQSSLANLTPMYAASGMDKVSCVWVWLCLFDAAQVKNGLSTHFRWELF